MQPPNAPEIIISYPEKDSVTYWKPEGFDSAQLTRAIPEDQRTEFYVSKSAYERFLIEYKTSPLAYRPNDVFEIIDKNRRYYSLDAARYIIGAEKPTIEYLAFLEQRRKKIKIFLEETLPQINDPNYILSLAEVTDALKQYKELASTYIASKYLSPSEDDKHKFYKSLQYYDCEDVLLQRYRSGGRIYYNGDHPFEQLDPKFQFSSTRLDQLFEAIAKDSGLSSDDVRSRFLTATGGLSDLSEERISQFRQDQVGSSSYVDDLAFYMREATKQRKYYTGSYDKYERHGKVNCAGAVCRSLSPLTGEAFSYKPDFLPRRPQRVVDKTRAMIKRVPSTRLGLVEDPQPQDCETILEAADTKFKEILSDILASINMHNSLQILQSPTPTR